MQETKKENAYFWSPALPVISCALYQYYPDSIRLIH